MKKRGLITSISVGVKKEEYSFIEKLAEESLNPDYITIDIAHGHANSVIDMIQHIKKYLPETFVIAGNVGTPEAVRELENAGADATKVGLVQEKYVLQKSRQALGLEAGNWQLLDGVRKQLASRSSLTVGSEHMAILQNLSVLVRQWS